MKALALAPVLALAAFALAAPPRADAGDRYSRNGYSRDAYGRNGGRYESRRGYGYRNPAPYYRSGRSYGRRYYAPRYYGRGYYAPRAYGYYDPYYYDDGYYAPNYYAPSYYGGYYVPPVRRYCPPRHRSRFGIFFGF